MSHAVQGMVWWGELGGWRGCLLALGCGGVGVDCARGVGGWGFSEGG